MISENTLRNSEFEEKMQLFLYDLILISAAKYNKVKCVSILFDLKLLLVKRSDNFGSMLIVLQLYLTELPLKSPYICTCTKEIWLLLQLLIERLHENGGQTNSFWHYFDAALNLHRERKSMNGKVSSNCIDFDNAARPVLHVISP